MKPQINKRENVSRPRGSGAEAQQGFTLIETAVALLIMMIAGLAIAGLFAYAINYNAGAYDRTLAHSLAQQRLEQLRAAPYDQVAASTESDVTISGHHFSVATTVDTTGALKTITVEVRPIRTGSSWARTPVIVMTQRAPTSLGSYFP